MQSPDAGRHCSCGSRKAKRVAKRGRKKSRKTGGARGDAPDLRPVAALGGLAQPEELRQLVAQAAARGLLRTGCRRRRGGGLLRRSGLRLLLRGVGRGLSRERSDVGQAGPLLRTRAGLGESGIERRSRLAADGRGGEVGLRGELCGVEPQTEHAGCRRVHASRGLEQVADHVRVPEHREELDPGAQGGALQRALCKPALCHVRPEEQQTRHADAGADADHARRARDVERVGLRAVAAGEDPGRQRRSGRLVRARIVGGEIAVEEVGDREADAARNERERELAAHHRIAARVTTPATVRRGGGRARAATTATGRGGGRARATATTAARSGSGGSRRGGSCSRVAATTAARCGAAGLLRKLAILLAVTSHGVSLR